MPVELDHALALAAADQHLEALHRYIEVERLNPFDGDAQGVVAAQVVELGAVFALDRLDASVLIASFFVKASIGALRAYPRLNAEIQGDEMILKHYYDIGVAVGASEGLVVPVIRDAERLSFAEIEKQIRDFAKRADDTNLSLAELNGGTFTITNGGVFGSLLARRSSTRRRSGSSGSTRFRIARSPSTAR